MNRVPKQRVEAKKILKQKLFNYQNQLKQQSNVIIYDAMATSGSQKLGLMTLSKNYVQFSGNKIKSYNSKEYDQYLNGNFQQEYTSGKKSLTRQNILSINKKGKAIKSSLNQMAKQRNSIQNHFLPYSSLQMSPNISPIHQQKSHNSQYKQFNQNTLNNLLTIKQSKQQQIQRPFDYIRKSVSQQTTRKKLQFQNNSRQTTITYRPKTAVKSYTTLNPQHQSSSPSELTQYYTPCHHKQTRTGYIVNDFQPRIRAKHFEDNIKVMAKMIKKKITNLERVQIVKYLKKIGERKIINSNPDGKIQQLVRKNNWLSQRNILQSKLVKAGRPEDLKDKSKKKLNIQI